MNLSHYLIVASAMMAIGLYGVVTRRNAIRILLSIELMLNASNLVFAAASSYLGNLNGQLFVMFVMIVAAAEVTVGLAIIVVMYRSFQHLNADQLDLLKW